MSTAPNTFVSEAFENALATFKSRLTEKELEHFRETRLQDVKIQIKHIQDDRENLKQNQNMTRLSSFLEAMEQFGKIVDVFLNASPFVAFVWGPLKFMLMVVDLLFPSTMLGEHR
jgi:transcriptional/translational regulatory protein YebC/TACO1